MGPHGTPTARSSARWQARISSAGASSNAAASQSASATATSSAADDESPAPTGRSLEIEPAFGRPPAQRVQLERDCGDVRLESADGRLEDGVLRRLARDGHGPVEGDREHQPARVVGVLADEVHPPGRAKPLHEA